MAGVQDPLVISIQQQNRANLLYTVFYLYTVVDLDVGHFLIFFFTVLKIHKVTLDSQI